HNLPKRLADPSRTIEAHIPLPGNAGRTFIPLERILTWPPKTVGAIHSGDCRATLGPWSLVSVAGALARSGAATSPQPVAHVVRGVLGAPSVAGHGNRARSAWFIPPRRWGGPGLPPPCPRATGAPRVKPCAPECAVCRGGLGNLGGRRGPRRGTVCGS